MNMKSEKKNHNIRHFGMMLVTVFLLISAFSASIIVSSYLFNKATREYREEIINKSARLAADMIDADRINQWLETGVDEEYMKTANTLKSICDNTPYVQYLYVYQIRQDGCHVIFDLETTETDLEKYDELPEVSTDVIGDIIEFDESFYDDIPTLLAGGQIDIKESNDSFGWLLTKYEPVFDSTGNCVAYVGVDISMIGVNDYNHTFLRYVVAISAFFLVVLTIGGYQYYKHSQKVDELEESERRRKQQHVLFEQTADALAGAIDAKDKYTNGHSRRVAGYSEKIARAAGKTDEECEKVYFAALLHDVGKIGVPLEILQKTSRLSDEEFKQIKEHPVVGGNILSSIHESPWLSIGARYHHEKYDGKGYPEGKKGRNIPEIARIIAVADAYDAMTSNRSYREAIPQHIVREELVKGSGSQFDPEYARIMIHMIDQDIEYKMKESISGSEAVNTDVLRCESIYHDCSGGIGISRRKTRIRLCSQPDGGTDKNESIPTIIIFDALDAHVHPGEEDNKYLLYYEYAQIRLDGKVKECNVRKSEVRFGNKDTDMEYPSLYDTQDGQRYMIEAVRNRDHIQLWISNEKEKFEVILALPCTSRYAYISITGEHLEVHNIKVNVDEDVTDWDAVPRIAEEISFIKDCPTGDIPNIQSDGPRLATTKGMLIGENMKLSFHEMSYPTARLVWHCPYFCIFTSSDGQVDGENYHEYLLLKMNGESWKSEEKVENTVNIELTEAFEGWDTWREKNKQGLDCNVQIRRESDRVFLQTENLGVRIDSISIIQDCPEKVYIALTGDQCAITDIHIFNE